MNDLLRAADAAASKNDRWLFLFVLFVFGVAVFFALKWLINKYESAVRDHRTDLQTYTTSLVSITSDYNRTNRELAVVLDRNSTALDETATELKICRERRNA